MSKPNRTWEHFKKPEWIDHEAFLFMGADPSWTPAKEASRSNPACDHCGGQGKVIESTGQFLPGAIDDDSPAVCPKCGRYGRQHLLDQHTPMPKVKPKAPPKPLLPTPGRRLTCKQKRQLAREAKQAK